MSGRKKAVAVLEENCNKKSARIRILKTVLKHIKNGISFLGLPGLSWEFEKYLLRKYPKAKVTGVEIDKKVYYFAKLSKPFEDISYFRGNISELLKISPETYNFIWLDYMGPYCPDYDEALNAIFSRDRIDCSNKKAILAITVKGSRDFYLEKLKNIAGLFNPAQARSTGIAGTIMLKAASSGYSAKLVDNFSYFGGTHSPMQVYIFVVKNLPKLSKTFGKDFNFSIELSKKMGAISG